MKSSITQIGLNADNLPIAQSVLANSHLEITLRHEMLDTVVGTPMGATPASAGGVGDFHPSAAATCSSRPARSRTSPAARISNVQFFQFLHGLNSQRGVYDNRAYSGTFSNFQYDVTLAGVDPCAVGADSSSAGLEDYLAFTPASRRARSRLGTYGIEGNGLDDHSIGKPSDGVHLSIENNWLTPPYSTREGTDEFAPAQRWVAGAQRWNLGASPQANR